MTDDARPATSSTTTPAVERRLRELTPTAMWTTAIVISAITAGAVIALWWAATKGLNNADLVNARLNALKIGLSIGVGSGGVVALYLAWRRQHSTEATLAHQQADAAATRTHQERVAEDTRTDAIERRITELYLKAVEQLGSDKAPVRLGGLYALERLAQDNESQRQTIVNVFCAYLRMLYEIPSKDVRGDGSGVEQGDSYRERVQEREVRRTAQHLLQDHLNPDHSPRYWGELDLDLTGAQLIDFTLAGARVGNVKFRNATFIGDASFDTVTFTGGAWFSGAIFTESATFSAATFSVASFDGAIFRSYAKFGEATFTTMTMFTGASFTREAWFVAATFTGGTWFIGAAFAGGARFDDVTFTDELHFDEATVSGGISFDRATADGKPLRPAVVSASDDAGRPA